MLRVTFFMEQGKGYRTYYRNLRPFVEINPEIAPTWVPMTYQPAQQSARSVAHLACRDTGNAARSPASAGRFQGRRPAMWPFSIPMCPQSWAAP